jgi:hypothetical protein
MEILIKFPARVKQESKKVAEIARWLPGRHLRGFRAYNDWTSVAEIRENSDDYLLTPRSSVNSAVEFEPQFGRPFVNSA